MARPNKNYRLELGPSGPQVATVHRLARVLGVPPETFVVATPRGVSQVSVREAATLLDMPEHRLQGWVRAGVLSGYKVGGHWRTPGDRHERTGAR